MAQQMIRLDSRGVVPRFEQYLGPWAMEPSAFNALASTIAHTDIVKHVMARAQSDDPVASAMTYEMYGNLAVIPIEGTITKYGSSLAGGTSAVMLRRAVQAAVRDESVEAIMLLVDSPGGSVNGVKEASDAVAEAAATKTVWAYCEDMCASAAYWIASHATHIVANGPAKIGSIGVYGVVTDSSAAAEQEGIKVHVVSTGDHKGAGVEGTEVTEAQLAEVQRIVDGINVFFRGALATGRGMDEKAIDSVADGRVWLAAEAQELGLIDAVVGSLDDALSQLSERTMRPSPHISEKEVSKMSDTPSVAQADETTAPNEPVIEPVVEAPPAPVAATLAEIKAACPGAPSDFVLEQAEAQATIEGVKSAYIARLEAASAAAQVQRDAAAVAPGTDGLDDSTTATASDDDPKAEWNRLLAEKVATGMSKSRAASAVNREYPELRQRLVDSANA